MNRSFLHLIFVLMVSVLCSGCETMAFKQTPTASGALRQLLELSTERATERLSSPGAYEQSEEYGISVPDAIAGTVNMLKVFGLKDVVTTFEKQFNRGAELAAQEARNLFIEEINDMQFSDAISVLRGGGHAATDYFEARTTDKLRSRYKKVIQDKLQKLDFYSTYQELSSAYRLLPIKNKPDIDLEGRVVDLGLSALYRQMAKEEEKIRQNPAELGSLLIASFLQ